MDLPLEALAKKAATLATAAPLRPKTQGEEVAKQAGAAPKELAAATKVIPRLIRVVSEAP